MVRIGRFKFYKPLYRDNLCALWTIEGNFGRELWHNPFVHHLSQHHGFGCVSFSDYVTVDFLVAIEIAFDSFPLSVNQEPEIDMPVPLVKSDDVFVVVWRTDDWNI